MEEVRLSENCYMNRVFVVSEYVYAAENSTGYFWSKVIDKLNSSLGEAHVIAPSPRGTSKKSLSKGVKYHELGSTSFDKDNLIMRLLGQLRLSFLFVRQLIKEVKAGDLVVSGTNPALLLMLMPWAKAFIRFKWCLLVHDVFPENLVPAGIVKKDSLFYRFLEKYFERVYSRADLIFVIGRDMKALVEKKTGSKREVVYIPNWVSSQDLQSISRNDSRILQSLGWQEKVVFQFFGNLGRVQGIENIVKAIPLVRSERAAFLFIGAGAKAHLVQSFIATHDGKNVVYLGSLDQADKDQGLAACDVALVTLEKGMAGLGVPSKAYFSMAADRPLLAVMDSYAEIALMVSEYQIGWTCEPSDPRALAHVIDEICAIQELSTARSPREVFESNFSDTVGLEKLMKFLRPYACREEGPTERRHAG